MNWIFFLAFLTLLWVHVIGISPILDNGNKETARYKERNDILQHLISSECPGMTGFQLDTTGNVLSDHELEAQKQQYVELRRILIECKYKTTQTTASTVVTEMVTPSSTPAAPTTLVAASKPSSTFKPDVTKPTPMLTTHATAAKPTMTSPNTRIPPTSVTLWPSMTATPTRTTVSLVPPATATVMPTTAVVAPKTVNPTTKFYSTTTVKPITTTAPVSATSTLSKSTLTFKPTESQSTTLPLIEMTPAAEETTAVLQTTTMPPLTSPEETASTAASSSNSIRSTTPDVGPSSGWNSTTTEPSSATKGSTVAPVSSSTLGSSTGLPSTAGSFTTKEIKTSTIKTSTSSIKTTVTNQPKTSTTFLTRTPAYINPTTATQPSKNNPALGICEKAIHLSESWRLPHHGRKNKGGSKTRGHNCDPQLFTRNGPQWFRFTEGAGNRMRSTCPHPSENCGSSMSIWSDHDVPTQVGQVVSMLAYAKKGGHCKYITLQILVMRCSAKEDDIVYKFTDDAFCSSSICGMAQKKEQGKDQDHKKDREEKHKKGRSKEEKHDRAGNEDRKNDKKKEKAKQKYYKNSKKAENNSEDKDYHKEGKTQKAGRRDRE